MIDLKQLFEITGESLAIDQVLDVSEAKLGEKTLFKQPAHLKGKLQNRAGVVTLSYTVELRMQTECDRCLAEVDTPLLFKFEHILVKQVNDDSNDDFIVVPSLKLDLDELALSDVILELPSKVLCKESCKGLCPICGVNLNEESCTCTQKRIDPRLEILSKFLEN
ncbi:MAG: DUF177 domain-containing protein [Hydrogenoanaerobacterium sp.]